MSAYHVSQEKSKRSSTVNNVNGTITSAFSIHHRIPVVNGYIKKPISGKLVLVSTVIAAYPAITTAALPCINGNQILYLLLPSFNASDRHSYNYFALIDAL